MVQPAGPVGQRRVMLALAFSDGNATRQVEFVFSEEAANRLGEALISGSVGVMRDFVLCSDGSG
jgi:hypothetical protein